MNLLKTLTVTVVLIALNVSLQAQDREFKLDNVYPVEENGIIHLNSDDAEVTIKGSDRSDVHVVIYRRLDVDGWKVKSDGEFSVEVENRDGDLYITENNTEEHRLVLGEVNEEYRITLEVPESVGLEIKGDDDTYDISNIDLGVNLSADDSDVELSDVRGENFTFNIDDGNIKMNEARGNLSLKMDDGELFVREAEFSEVDADYDDGQIDITTSLADDGLYLFDMDDGELELSVTGGGGTFEIDHDDQDLYVGDQFEKVRSDEDESVYRLEGGNARIEIDTDDGRVELQVE